VTRSTLDAAGACNRRADPVWLGHSMQGSIQSNEDNDQNVGVFVQTEMRIEVEFTSVCTVPGTVPGARTQLPRSIFVSTKEAQGCYQIEATEKGLHSLLLVISAIYYITCEEPRVNHGGTSRKYRLILMV
jgi:hypothetical protein